MKEEKGNPYVHKFTRRYMKIQKEQKDGGLSPRLKLAGIIMIACIAVPLLLMGVSLLAGLIQK
jgi:hypothetical protein